MLDMELSSSITARFSTKRCGFCRTNLDAALSVQRQMSTDHQIATRGHDLEYRGTEEVLVVESPSVLRKCWEAKGNMTNTGPEKHEQGSADSSSKCFSNNG